MESSQTEPITEKVSISPSETVFNLPARPNEMEEKQEVPHPQIPQWPYGVQQLPAKKLTSTDVVEGHLRPDLQTTEEKHEEDQIVASFSDDMEVPHSDAAITGPQEIKKLKIHRKNDIMEETWPEDYKIFGKSYNGHSLTYPNFYEPTPEDNLITSFKQAPNGKTYVFITRQVENNTIGQINFEISTVEGIINYLSKLYFISHHYLEKQMQLPPNRSYYKKVELNFLTISSSRILERQTCAINFTRKNVQGKVSSLWITSKHIFYLIDRLSMFQEMYNFNLRKTFVENNASVKRPGDLTPINNVAFKKQRIDSVLQL